MAVTSRPIPARASAWRRALPASLITASVYLLALLAITVLLTQGAAWAQRRLDDLRYGYPRTAHLAGVVGNGDSAAQPTHMIGINLDGQISILVAPAGDTTRLTTLPGPYVIGQGGDAAVPLLGLADLSGDGAPDLLLTVRGEIVVYINHDGTFELITAEERAMLNAAPPAP